MYVLRNFKTSWLMFQNLGNFFSIDGQASVRLIRRELVDIGISEYCLKHSQAEWSGTAESGASFPVPLLVIRQITVDVGKTKVRQPSG